MVKRSFQPDQPIQSAQEDQLGRGAFASALGRAVLSYSGLESTVVGLSGEWGTGKTSVANLMIEEVLNRTREFPKSEQPIIVRFNPWNFSDQNQLIQQFFRQLSAEFGRAEPDSRIRKAGETLQAYSNALFQSAPAPASGTSIEAARKAPNPAEAPSARPADLCAIREELNRLLAAQQQKIVIVIDDIERLSRTEIRQVFQLAKSLAGFPNTIYVLVYDKDMMVKTLDPQHASGGREYLEKIVQIPFEIPPPSREDVHRLLFHLMSDVAEFSREHWNRMQWADLFHRGIMHLVRNVRDAVRYANALRFSFPMIEGEVNAPDMLAIVAIHVFAPDLYGSIRDNPERFSGVVSERDRPADKELEAQRAWYEGIFARNTVLTLDQWKVFLPRLFPKLDYFFGQTVFGSASLAGWNNECRICSPERFRVYFQLSLSKPGISASEQAAIIAAGRDENAFAEELRRLVLDGRINLFLEQLEDHIGSLPLEHVRPMLHALFQTTDSFPQDRGLFELGPQLRASRAISALLKRYKREQIFAVLKELIENAASGLRRIIDEVSEHDREHGRFRFAGKEIPPEERTLTAEELDATELLALERIRDAARAGVLLEERGFIGILYRWKEWGPPHEVSESLLDLIQTDSGLVGLLKHFREKRAARRSRDSVPSERALVILDVLADFIDLESVESQIRAVRTGPDYESLPIDQKRLLEMFLTALCTGVA